MAFNFGISDESAVRSTRRPLAPWGIYDVKFKGCEVREFNGVKDPTAHYKVLDIKFENEDGYFTVTKFFPREGDDVRRTTEGKNGTVTFPSTFEVLMKTVSQTAQVLNPVGFEKFQKASSSFRSFDDVCKALIAVTKPAIDTEIKIKLVGVNRNGKVVADIPRIVALTKEGDAFIADNYIGSKLFFTDYEDDQRQKYLNATPTAMKEDDPLAVAQEKDDSNFDLDDLAQL